MSSIHKFIESKETTEAVKTLFKRFFDEFEKQNSTAWNEQVTKQTPLFHRKKLLKQGQCDFDNPPLNLTTEELIILYNYYYFPMHYQSSYDIYDKLFSECDAFKNKTLFFQDYGCGTLSSTMAFSACFQKYKSREIEDNNELFYSYPSTEIKSLNEFKYNEIDVCNHLHFYVADKFTSVESGGELGIIRNAQKIFRFDLPDLINGYFLFDKSNNLTKYLTEFLKENFYVEPYCDYFFNMASCTDGHFYFSSPADKFYIGNFVGIDPFKSFCQSQQKSAKDVTVILNFSYVFASESIDIDKLVSTIDEYQKSGCQLIIVNQNPDIDAFNEKWEILKKRIKYIQYKQGVLPIKFFPKNSKSRFEVIYPITYEIFFAKCINLYNQNQYVALDKYLNEFFKSNFEPLIIEIKLDMLNESGEFDLSNYITEFAFAHNYFPAKAYYHQKAHLYRDINSNNIAKFYYEKEILERRRINRISDGGLSPCYTKFMDANFPNDNYLSLENDDLPF